MPVVRNRSPKGPRYSIVRSPPPDVYLTDVLIDVVLIWCHALRCLGALLTGVCRGAAAELRRRPIEEEIAEVVAEIARKRATESVDRDLAYRRKR